MGCPLRRQVRLVPDHPNGEGSGSEAGGVGFGDNVFLHDARELVQRTPSSTSISRSISPTVL